MNTHFRKFLQRARMRCGISQEQLAKATSLHQSDISQMEQGKRLPSFQQLLDLAHTLEVSVQWFLTGSNSTGSELADLVFQLRELRILDLQVENARVPGAFHPNEEAIVLALAGNTPSARIIEAIPAVLAWNDVNHEALRMFANLHDPRIKFRLAWLADIAITIHQSQGFPGGCPCFSALEMFISKTEFPNQEDTLGLSQTMEQLPPASLRWKMRYPAQLATFRERAERLDALNQADTLRWRRRTLKVK